jgi:4-hydroxy-3-methylbut-2-enyl diphosphate reductase
VIVVGSVNSSNSNRLRELSEKLGTTAYLLDNADELQADWLEGKQRVGLTAGASAPEVLVQRVVSRLAELGVTNVEEDNGLREDIEFSLPRELKIDVTSLRK